ncbi:MAG: HNH endonuclease [Ignavibacterium sp.]|uniref:HNH endonuclease n=1 Tax=Ignavibacterium sp. TaxID=2651167 RepID=UPI00329A7490
MQDGFSTPDLYDGFDDFLKQYTDTLFHPFRKFSVLHSFISFAAYESFKEDVDDVVVDSVVNQENFVLWVNEALSKHKISYITFREWLHQRSLSVENIETEAIILEYYENLYQSGPLKKLLEKIADEVFFVLFLNRHFLYLFNKQISLRTRKIQVDELSQNLKVLFKRDGVLERANIPAWARKAVFYRDRGLCSNCQKDISGLLSIQSAEHFDHIIPLALGGLNDVSNLQLLCETCNLAKSGNELQASKTYERWY